VVIGNYIGTDATGTQDRGNQGSGIFIQNGASSNRIGGTAAGERNIISGNNSSGIYITNASNNLMQGNYIGVDINGTANLGNGSTGVQLTNNSNNNTIGGTAAGAANRIAFNSQQGVLVISGAQNLIAGNEIFSSGGLGIDLFGNGVTANDAGDGDTGPNNLQNYPVLSSALIGSGVTTVTGSLNSTANTTFTLEFFSNTANDASGFGEGETFQGSTTVTTDGAGNANFTFNILVALPAGQFVSATATDPNNNTSEFAQSVQVTCASPAITAQPANQTVCAGSTATFSVTATGAVSYQWRKNGVNISGATASSYTIPAAVAGDAASYSVVVTNACGSVTSNAATLTVNPATAITTQPQNQTACLGGSATFSVTATGAGLSYQWRKGGVNIAGATASSFTIPSVAAGDAASYDVVVTGSCGAVTSSAATLTINPSTTITAQPVNQTACAGGSATFTVAASGSGALSYQWRKGGVNIPGATAANLTINPVAAGDAGSYDVVVSNSCGTVTSSAATLTVNPATAITSQPANQTVCAGSPATFSVTATGTGLSYQWRKGGVVISGATSSSFSIPSAAAGDAGNYDVVVTGSCGTVISNTASLTVNAGATITSQPTNQTVCAGSPASFSVTATGTGLSYQWRKGGVAISGATASSFTIPSAAAGDAGSYDVVITSSCGSITSNAATLTVNPATAITTQPANQSASAGQSVTFSVTASGASLTYQWRKNGSAISGATGSSYTIASVAAADAGNYDVVVAGACGAVTSNAATLTINSGCATPVVSITGPANGFIYPVGTAVNFSGSFTDASGGTHAATWTFDALTQSGVVNESAGTVSGVYTFAQAGVYQVTLTVGNSCGQQGAANLIGGLTALVVVYDPDGGFVTGGRLRARSEPDRQGQLRLRLEVQEGRQRAGRPDRVQLQCGQFQIPEHGL